MESDPTVARSRQACRQTGNVATHAKQKTQRSGRPHLRQTGRTGASASLNNYKTKTPAPDTRRELKNKNIMKKIYVCMLVLGIMFGSFTSANAQSKFKRWFTESRPDGGFKHSVGVAPLFISKGLRITYETPLKEKMSLGGILSAYLWSGYSNGVMIAPFGRWYFSGKPADYGFYGQVKPMLGFFSYSVASEKKKNFITGGFGLNVGYQFNFKNPRWSLDVSGGFKWVGAPNGNDNYDTDAPAGSDEWMESVNDAIDDMSWNMMGPGSVLDFSIVLCYRF